MDTSDTLEQPSRETLGYLDRITWLARLIVHKIIEAIESGNYSELKTLLALFGESDPHVLKRVTVLDRQPFKHTVIFREPDDLWEQTIASPHEPIAMDTHCSVAEYKGKTYVRWSIPRPEYYEQCSEPDKLIYTLLVVIEELFHLSQNTSSNSRNIHSLDLVLRFKKIESISEMDEEDREHLRIVLESDITHTLDNFGKIFGESFPGIRRTSWLKDRLEGDKIHRPLEGNEMISYIIYLIEKYGDPEDLLDYMKHITEFVSSSSEYYGSLLESKELFDLLIRYGFRRKK